MSGHSSEEWLLLFVTALIVIVFVFYFVRRLWNYPLAHGPGFFLDAEVAPGFYNGEGVRWLKRYRTILLALHLVMALALAVILVSGRWSLLPLWAGGVGVFASAARLRSVYPRHTWSESARPNERGRLTRNETARRLYLMAFRGIDGRDHRLMLGPASHQRECAGAMERSGG